MTHILASVTLALWLLFGPAPDGTCPDCTAGGATELCTAHVLQERKVLRQHAKALRSDDSAKRIAALESIAALTAEHANAPSPTVAKQLVKQLGAEDLNVQRRAAELLGEGQHQATALDGLIRKLPSVDEDLVGLCKAFERLNKKRDPLLTKWHTAAMSARDTQKLRGLNNDRRRMETVISLHEKLRTALAKGLGKIPDARATHTLLESLAQDRMESIAGLELREALLKHGTRSGLQACAEFMEREDAELVARRKLHAEAEQESAPTVARYWQGTEQAWKGKFAQEHYNHVMVLDSRVTDIELDLLMGMRALKKFGASRGFSSAPKEPPLGSVRFPPEWKQWIDENAMLLPETAGSTEETGAARGGR